MTYRTDISSKEKKAIIAIMALTAIATVFSALRYGIPFSPDTLTYTDAADSLMAGNIDAWRTPVYPLVIWLCKAIAGNHYEWLLATLQITAFVATIPLFHKSAKFAAGNAKVACAATAVFAAIVIESGFCQFVLSESFAVTLTVVLIYFTTEFLRRPHTPLALAICATVLLIVFLRPAQIYVLPIAFFFAAIAAMQRKQCRKPFVVIALGMCIIGGILFGYASAFNRQHGVFALTCVNTYNNYYASRFEGILSPEAAADNPLLKADIAGVIDQNGLQTESDSACWDEVTSLISRHSLAVVNHMVDNAVNAHRQTWWTSVARRAASSAVDYRFPTSWIPQFSQRLKPFSIPYLAVYALLFIFAVVAVAQLHRKASARWYSLILLTAILGNMTVAIIGAKDDFDRLLFPSVPILILIVETILAQIITLVKQKSNSEQI